MVNLNYYRKKHPLGTDCKLVFVYTICLYNEIQLTLVISNFTGPDKNVRVISSSRQPNCDVIGMTTVRLPVRQNVLGRHMYMAI